MLKKFIFWIHGSTGWGCEDIYGFDAEGICGTMQALDVEASGRATARSLTYRKYPLRFERIFVERRLLILLMTVIMSSINILFIVSAHPAEAACSKSAQDYSPTYGSVSTWSNKYNTSHRVTFRFRLSQKQLWHLRCYANYLEVDFELAGSGLPANWEGYQVTTDIPHAGKDTPYKDEGNPRPSVTNIHTKELQIGRKYFMTISWDKYVPGVVIQKVRISWAPSYWAGAWWTLEGALCEAKRYVPKWCIFGKGGISVLMWRSFFPASMPNGWLPFWSGYEMLYKIDFDKRRAIE